MVWLVAMVAVGPQAGGLYSQVVPNPTGRNGYEEYVRAAVLASHPDVKKWEETAPPFPAGLRANSTRLERSQWVLNRLKPAMELIRQGNAKPVLEPRDTYSPATLMPELAHFRQLSKVLAGAAYADFAAGRSSQGTDRLLDNLVFGDNVSRTGTLVSHLVGIAQMGIAFGAFESRLPQLAKPDCQRIVQTTTALLERPSAFANVLEMEQALSAKGLTDLLEGRDDWIEQGEFRFFANKLKEKSPGERNEIRRLALQMLKERFGAVIQAYRGPESGWPIATKEPVGEEPTRMPETSDEMAEALVHVFAPVTTQGGFASMRSRTQMRLLRLHAWVLAFRWEFDRYPTSLAEAAPADALTDPLNGQPFEYTIVPGGYRLLSKGRDGTGEIALRYQRPPGQPGGAGSVEPPR
jgi:hypothetical protein